MNMASNFRIIKRTFEGETNPEKNLSPITSKYIKSKKYALVFDVKFEHGGTAKDVIHLYESKKFAETVKENLIRYGY